MSLQEIGGLQCLLVPADADPDPNLAAKLHVMPAPPKTAAQAAVNHAQDVFGKTFVGPGWPDRFGEWLADWSAKSIPRPIKTLSLFTGAGGLDIGFHQAGFHSTEMVEFDQRFVPTLVANASSEGIFQGAKPLHGDVRSYDPSHLSDIDFIIGGPPCQSFSAAGRRAGGVQGTSDDRGQLFLAYVKLLKRLKPVGFLFENVYGITGANGGQDWTDIQNAFSDAGYQISFRVLDAADFGAPQHRERMFIVGLLRGKFQFPRPTHGPDSCGNLPNFDAKTAIDHAVSTKGLNKTGIKGRYGHLLSEVPPGLNYSYFTERMGHPQPIFAWRSKFSDFLYKADPDRPVRTIKAQGGQYTGPFHWADRPFAISELKRLQTFPDKYEILGGRTTVVQQIGNSVPPQIARILALTILEQVFEVSPPFKLDLLGPNEILGFRSRKRGLTKEYEKIAARHLKHRTADKTLAIRPRTSVVKLTHGFTISEEVGGVDEAYTVRFQPGKKCWRFSVGANGVDAGQKGFSIALKPRADTVWQLPCNSVELVGSDFDPAVFIIAWKSFEAALQRYRVKADLVQLSGYYQYETAITSTMKVHGRTPWKWRTLTKPISGVGIREILPAETFANRWGISTERFFEFADFLRTLGMEIRNHHTNPQIPVGSWMLPYLFPSLNHQSVQLNKEIRK